jgi:hypothetical protein
MAETYFSNCLQSMDTFVAPEYDEDGKAFVEAIGMY